MSAVSTRAAAISTGAFMAMNRHGSAPKRRLMNRGRAGWLHAGRCSACAAEMAQRQCDGAACLCVRSV